MRAMLHSSTWMSRLSFYAACAFAVVFVQAASGARDATPPDTIFYNGKITTVDDANTTVQALAVRDGRILARGSNLRVLSLARRGTANGATVTPRALAFITAGHERHHLNILRERYV